jgi:UDP-N-acetylmuramate dehydrogenase
MVDLTSFNTLQVPAKANNLITLKTLKSLKTLKLQEPYLFLGQGANVLFVHDFPGTIIRVDLKGKKIISENDDEIIVELAAGENWHEFVTWAVENNYSGIENLALIPGTVGAAVVGNIGAYGQEVKNTISNVQYSMLNELRIMNNEQCEFDYRESFFKHHKEYLVTAAQFRLFKKFKLNDSYIKFPENCNLQQAFDFIVATRQSKLPDWTKIGTAGSFFKNPVLTSAQCAVLSTQIPDLKIFNNKVHAGKLLDVLGWKGKRIGNVSTHDKSALVIVNLGGATGQEIFDYAEMMRADVKNNFKIGLEYEVRII